MVIVFFDLETTGLIRNGVHPSICQIGAASNGGVFDVYCMPDQEIEPKASEVNGLKISRRGHLLKNGEPVETCSVEDGLISFMDWIESLVSTNRRSRKMSRTVILIAHNGSRFDNPILRRACADYGVSIPDCVIGTFDSIPLLKEALPPRKRWALQILMDEIFDDYSYEAHDAKEDSEALMDLMEETIGEEANIREMLGL